MRRFGPAECGLRPARVTDQRRNGGKQRDDNVIGRARRRLGRAQNPVTPCRPEEAKGEICGGGSGYPQHGHVGLGRIVAVALVQYAQRDPTDGHVAPI
jgi:hypothetical protein